MRALPTTFRERGFDHRILYREGDVVMDEQTFTGASGTVRRVWNVVRISRNPEREIHGVRMEASESYPPPEAWGSRGWTYTTHDSAWIKFKTLAADASSGRSEDGSAVVTLPGAQNAR